MALMGNAQRLLLDEEVMELVSQAGQNEAYSMLESAYEIQEREQRAMSLEEALRIVRGVAAQVEAIG
jgi:hypothetical protein